MHRPQSPAHYFLTGATGILGTEILTQLVAHTKRAKVTCVIRAGDAAQACERLTALLRYASYWRPDLDFSGVEAVRGDILESGLGIASAGRAQLCKTVTHVIHSAASIHLDGDEREMRRINVGGTKEVAAFAGKCPKLKRFLPISTAYVAGLRKGEVSEEDLDEGQGFVNNYERSKLESELFVRSLKKTMPVTVVRPSIIVGDSRDGHVQTFQNIYIPMYFFGMGAVPDLPGNRNTLIDIVPVDYVAEVVVRTLHSEACIGGTYHACSGAGRQVALADLMGIAKDALHSARRIRPMARVARVREQLSCFFDYLSHSRNFGVSALRRDLAEDAPPRPDPEKFLPRLVEFWCEARFGKRMPWLMSGLSNEGVPLSFGGTAGAALCRETGAE